MWSRSSSLRSCLGPRSRVARGSEAQWTTAHPRELPQLRHLDRAACVLSRGDVTAAATARATLLPEISLFVIPFRTVDNLDTRMQRLRAGTPFTNFLAVCSQCHQVTSSKMVHSRTAPFRTSVSQNATSSCSPIFAELQQWPCRVAQSLATRRFGQKALREPSVVTSLGP